MADLAANLEAVRGRLAAAAERSGRAPSDVDLLVVTKTWPAEVVRTLVDAGHDLLGENKVQDALEKIPLLPERCRWHFIGQLQRNKARKVVEAFEAIHSIDSLRLASHVDRLAGETGRRPQVYLQVNLGAEESKGGFVPGELPAMTGELVALEHLQVEGLMCIPPAVPSAEEARASFVALRTLRNEIQQATGRALPGLSMGMSHDYEVAIEEGSTIVRVGSAIFGPRGI